MTIVIALLIAYIAYQGYIRNDSRPILYIAAGFVLAFGGPGLLFILSLVFPMPIRILNRSTLIVEITGMGMILYGFIASVGM